MLKKDRVQGCVTAGVALVGASVMAISPVAPQAPGVLKAQEAQVQLAAAVTGSTAELFAQSGLRAAQAFVGAPLGFNLAAAALAAGNAEAAYNALEAVIDGPLWAADPAIYAFDDLLPAPIGGDPNNEQTEAGTSAITQFRANVLIALRDALRDFAAQAVGYDGSSVTTLAATPETYTQSPAELFALSGLRAAQAFLGAPLGIAQAATLLAQGENYQAYKVLEDVVDGPLWAADPAIYALDDLLPAPFGGDRNVPTEPGTGAITQFRAQVLIAARDAVRGLVFQAVGSPAAPSGARLAVVAEEDDFDAVAAATRLAEGFGESAVRAAQSTVAAPLGLVAIADGLKKSFSGDGNSALYKALQAYVDGPNYVADPVVFAVDDVLPKPIGGDPEEDPAKMGGSEVTKFRANVLLAPRDQVRKVVAGALGVDPVTGNELPAAGATVEKSVVPTSDVETKKSKPSLPQVRLSFDASKQKPGEASESTGGKHRAPTTSLGDGLRKMFGKKDTEKKPQESEKASDAGSESE